MIKIFTLGLVIIFSYIINNQNLQPNPGKEQYETYCIACHAADGKGQKGVNPPLVNSPWVNGEKEVLIKTVLQGMTEPIIIDGTEYTNAMPAHDWLEDKDLADLLTYVRTDFGQKKDTITIADIVMVRQKLK